MGYHNETTPTLAGDEEAKGHAHNHKKPLPDTTGANSNTKHKTSHSHGKRAAASRFFFLLLMVVSLISNVYLFLQFSEYTSTDHPSDNMSRFTVAGELGSRFLGRWNGTSLATQLLLMLGLQEAPPTPPEEPPFDFVRQAWPSNSTLWENCQVPTPFVPKPKQYCLHHPVLSSFQNNNNNTNGTNTTTTTSHTTPVYLAAHLYVRIYAEDKPQLSKLDIAHWMTYYRYAGFERIYLYDNWVHPWEKLDDYPPIAQAIASGFVHYHDWHEYSLEFYQRQQTGRGGNHMSFVEAPAKRNAQKAYGEHVRWMSFLDVDEYVTVPGDEEPGFVSRFLAQLEESDQDAVPSCKANHRHHTLVMLNNVLCHGGRDYSQSPFLMGGQVPRIEAVTESNSLHKYIGRLDDLSHLDIHFASINRGRKFNDKIHQAHPLNPNKTMATYHYWGGRVMDWKLWEEFANATSSQQYYQKLEAVTRPLEPPSTIVAAMEACFDLPTMESWPTIHQEKEAYLEALRLKEQQEQNNSTNATKDETELSPVAE